MSIVPANPVSIEHVLDLLNQVFIRDKKKEIPLDIRYPFLFTKNNYNNIFTVVENDRMVSCCVTYEIAIFSHHKTYQFFLLGFVATHPDERSKGYSTQLLQSVSDHFLKKQKFDGGFLWTGIPSFYNKLGWKELPEEILISLAKSQRPSKQTLDAYAIEKIIDKLTVDITFQRLFELEFGYRCDDENVFIKEFIPASVTKFYSHTILHHQGFKSYVSIGLQETTGYLFLLLYENKTVLADLIDWLLNQFKLTKIIVNVHQQSKIADDLKAHFQIQLETRKMGMYLTSSEHKFQPNDFFLPFIMRI